MLHNYSQHMGQRPEGYEKAKSKPREPDAVKPRHASGAEKRRIKQIDSLLERCRELYEFASKASVVAEMFTSLDHQEKVDTVKAVEGGKFYSKIQRDSIKHVKNNLTNELMVEMDVPIEMLKAFRREAPEVG